uniref:Bulb-type lectin domain-containing protein n=1 Tax=Monopterus albus TaxID=43700 RepID=A0A3Q3IWF9_MONAL
MEAARHSISANQTLLKGEAIFSRSGKYKAVFEKNGNFVLYGWKKIWASNTPQFNGDCIVLEDDGTLAIYQGGQKLCMIVNVWGKPECPEKTPQLHNVPFMKLTHYPALLVRCCLLCLF